MKRKARSNSRTARIDAVNKRLSSAFRMEDLRGINGRLLRAIRIQYKHVQLLEKMLSTEFGAGPEDIRNFARWENGNE